jgi:aminopeptidase N
LCRQAFPCWDEPAIKATFDVTITAPADRVVLSNMPEIITRPHTEKTDLKTVYFDRTPIMSTYLVAFVVGE